MLVYVTRLLTMVVVSFALAGGVHAADRGIEHCEIVDSGFPWFSHVPLLSRTFAAWRFPWILVRAEHQTYEYRLKPGSQRWEIGQYGYHATGFLQARDNTGEPAAFGLFFFGRENGSTFPCTKIVPELADIALPHDAKSRIEFGCEAFGYPYQTVRNLEVVSVTEPL
ncbi:MAG: hypothetical protein VYD64_03450, partial [Pseudomonadota bacterium]|nr:hypothetical protein [Pseudomonadota bacterium]